jgi:hypothetical protein
MLIGRKSNNELPATAAAARSHRLIGIAFVVAVGLACSIHVIRPPSRITTKDERLPRRDLRRDHDKDSTRA